MKDRIYQLMKANGKNQKDFAEELCIAQASLSGIFKGTTKPSNNIVNSIHERYPEVNILWLMFGEGEMYVKERITETTQSLFPASGALDPMAQGTVAEQQDLFSTPSQVTTSIPPQTTVVRESVKYIDKPQRKITEIRVFFDDGTFETFHPDSR